MPFASVFLSIAACASESTPLDWEGVPEEIGQVHSTLSSAARKVRARQIRDAAAGDGLSQGWLLAGIADAETGMSQCWSELTWACQGPASSDCGGGPVVAGAGDGPCRNLQGGLGMFQFDAGTHQQTINREGSSVLTVAGNTDAAVRFAISMVKRSRYISGVTTSNGALQWMNGVRVGNSKWDAWVRTVTHYYNGCAPGARCFSSRYARYRDFTSKVYREMGADFWNAGAADSLSGTSEGGSTVAEFQAELVSQTFATGALTGLELAPGQTHRGSIVLRNTGSETWLPGEVFLAPTSPRNHASRLATPTWISPSRIASVDTAVEPGEEATFTFDIAAPAVAGDHNESLSLVYSSGLVQWFAANEDELARVSVRSTQVACSADSDFVCGEGLRTRCVDGVVVGEFCNGGCNAGVCEAAEDTDLDGFAGEYDCDESNPTSYAGAFDLCEDGADSDCDGIDPVCGAVPDAAGDDANESFEDDANALPEIPAAGCSARGNAALVLPFFALLFAVRRRRR